MGALWRAERDIADVVAAIPTMSHFEVELNEGRVVLTPARIGAADAVRRKLAELHLTDADVTDAIAWACGAR